MVAEIVHKCGIFRGLDADSLARLAAVGRIVRFPKGRVIFRQGDPCPGVYCVGAGVVRMFRLAPSGKELVLHLAAEGDTFAEVAALGRFACPASAECIEVATCALLPVDPLHAALQASHPLCLQLLSSMALWVRRFVGLLEDIVLRDAAGRVAQFLVRSDPSDGTAAFALPMLKKDLASHLNLTSETLSRTLRRFAEAGLIALPDNRRVRVLDSAALREVAEGLLPAEFA